MKERYKDEEKRKEPSGIGSATIVHIMFHTSLCAFKVHVKISKHSIMNYTIEYVRK